MGLMANLRQFSSIFRKKCQKNAVFHRKSPPSGKMHALFGKKAPDRPSAPAVRRGREPEEPGGFCLRRRETGRMPNKGLILFVIREK